MAYTVSANNSPATGSVAIYLLKTLLKSLGWTVPRSSDGTTYNSSGDQITGGGSGANGFGNNSAWFVLQHPTNGRQFCFQRATGGATRDFRIKYSASAGFTGGSPGATQTPSAADEHIILGGGTDAAPTFVTLFSADGGYKFHAVGGGSAEGYGFVCFALANTTGAGSAGGVLFYDPMLAGSTATGDTDPVVVGRHTNANTIMTATNMDSTDGIAFAQMGAGTFTNVGANSFNESSTVVVPGGAGTNPWTGKDDLFPVPWLRSQATVGYKGISTLFRWGSVSRANGDLATDKSKVYVGQMWLPWDGSTTITL